METKGRTPPQRRCRGCVGRGALLCGLGVWTEFLGSSGRARRGLLRRASHRDRKEQRLGLDVWRTAGIWPVPTLCVSGDSRFLLERKRGHRELRGSKSEPKPQSRALRKPRTRGSSQQEAFPVSLGAPSTELGGGVGWGVGEAPDPHCRVNGCDF